jgi:hypothetical protein
MLRYGSRSHNFSALKKGKKGILVHYGKRYCVFNPKSVIWYAIFQSDRWYVAVRYDTVRCAKKSDKFALPPVTKNGQYFGTARFALKRKIV